MKTVKCRFTEYRKLHYLIFDNGRIAEIGDRVLSPTLISLQRVVEVNTDYGNEGLGYLDQSGNTSHLLSQSPVVAAISDELSKRDIEALKEKPTCYIFEDNGEILNFNRNILISFESISYSRYLAKNDIL